MSAHFYTYLFHIIWRTGRRQYQLIMMVDTGGIRTCVHLHVSQPLHHCATDMTAVNVFYNMSLMDQWLRRASQENKYPVHGCCILNEHSHRLEALNNSITAFHQPITEPSVLTQRLLMNCAGVVLQFSCNKASYGCYVQLV